jgi:glycosyltransferase involved in cell wall biosynthesis
MTKPKIRVAIFSYNRPDHLANCLTSLRDLWPDADVVIYDDNSKHPGMKKVFQKFGVPVVVGKGGTGRHGGLYSNMQMAYEQAKAERFEYLLTLQDDMQLVRPFDTGIENEYLKRFAQDERLTQIDPRFAKTPKGESKPAEGNQQLKEQATKQPFKDYLDVGLFHIGRLNSVGWSFVVEGSQIISGEMTLSLKAADLGMKKVAPRTPFVMHLPFPHLYRHRLRLPRLSGLSRKIFRFQYLTAEDILSMDERPQGQPAYWRNHLKIADANWFDRWLLSGKDDAKILQ